MGDLKNPSVLYAKGCLLLAVGVLASVLLLADRVDAKSVLLLAVAVWVFCRAYYFAFYVIEHYIDPGYKYAGLLSFVQHALSRRMRR